MKQDITKIPLATLIADRAAAKDRRHLCVVAIGAGHPKSSDKKIDYEVDLAKARKVIAIIDAEIERRRYLNNSANSTKG